MIPAHILHNQTIGDLSLEVLPPHFLTRLDDYWAEVSWALAVVEDACQGEPPSENLLLSFSRFREALRRAIPIYERDTLRQFLPFNSLEAYTIDSLRTDN